MRHQRHVYEHQETREEGIDCVLHHLLQQSGRLTVRQSSRERTVVSLYANILVAVHALADAMGETDPTQYTLCRLSTEPLSEIVMSQWSRRSHLLKYLDPWS